MKQHFAELFEYSNYFNQKLIALLFADFHNIPEKTYRLINHVVNAQQIWNARITTTKQYDVWQINNPDELAGIDTLNYQNSLKIIEDFDLNQTVMYTNSKGENFSNTIKDILFHVINHSTYHRAQIATDLKEHGIEPLNTDYIFYRRKLE